ncbi:MAG: hypothetical protein EHM20_15705 [Alphaproteobacteria bacterium]|nr:MAG: hypothetical protein EHM20_15705 [Alphaproteobacteria bacterium]
MKTKKRLTPFSTDQQLKELCKYVKTFQPASELQFTFMDTSIPRKEKSVDGDNPSWDILDCFEKTYGDSMVERAEDSYDSEE